MKLLIKYFVLCLFATQFIACQKDAAKPSGQQPATANAIAGNFTVTSFISSGEQTSVFNGFAFTFNENGTVVATKGTTTFNGSWTFDDGNTTEIKIHFVEAPLNQLNKSWHISHLTEDNMLLTDDHQYEEESDDDSPGNSKVEFERD